MVVVGWVVVLIIFFEVMGFEVIFKEDLDVIFIV